MTQLPSYPDSNNERDDAGGARRADRAASGPPRWAAMLGIIIGILIFALFVTLHLTGVVGPGGH